MSARSGTDPQEWATARRSSSASVGLAGVSKKNALVLGWIAASQASLSRPSIAVWAIPNRLSTLLRIQRHEPNASRSTTTWSPALSMHNSALVIAAMPLACTLHASAPSIAAMRASSIATVGFWKREYCIPDDSPAKRSATVCASSKV